MSIENETISKPNQIKYKKFHIKAPEALIITYSWSSVSHGICGHNFETYELLHHLNQTIPNEETRNKIKVLIPENENQALKVLDALKDKYQNFDEYKDKIIYGNPTILTAKTVILCDGTLPTRGNINAERLIIILCGKDFWWAKNINIFTGKKIEIWYDSRIGYDVNDLKEKLLQQDSSLDIKFKDSFVKTLNFKIYNKQNIIGEGLIPSVSSISSNSKQKRYMVYATGNCRDIYRADVKHHSDTLKEIKDIIVGSVGSNGSKSLLILGWNPNYTIEEKYILNQNKQNKIYHDRRMAANTAADLSEYFDCEVQIIPECDLPLTNLFNEFDTYIYTPTEKNWDCSSRLIPECKYFGKELILTNTAKKLLETNTGLKVRIQDYFPELLK